MLIFVNIKNTTTTITNNMATTTIRAKNIDINKITFSAPRVLDNGAKLVYMNYDGGRLSVQTPWMSTPWKMGVYTEGEYPKYSLDLSFKGMDLDADLQKFHDNMKLIEEKIIDAGHENSVAWFKRKKSTREAAEALFNRILKVSKDPETGEPDGKWPPTMKLKISRKNGTWEAGRDRSGREKPLVVKNSDGNVYKINSEDNLEDIFVKNTRLRVKMSCVGLWVASGNYMCQWQLTHAEVDIKDTEDNDEFLPDTDDEADVDNVQNNDGIKVEDSDDDDNADTNNVDNDNDEDHQSPVPSPDPAPPQAPKKKVVKRVVKKKSTNNE